MRTAPAIAAIPLLVILLTWLSVRAIDLDAEGFDEALAELDRFELLQAEIHRDVLSARAGTLRNYDPLAQETTALIDSVDRLRQSTAFAAPTASLVDRLAAMVLQQEGLVEQFKSNNALLQNSLAYIALFSGEESGPLARLESSLAAAMLRFTLDTSPVAAREVQVRLDVLTRRWVDLMERSLGDGTPSMEALLSHVRLLHRLLPETDNLLKSILSLPQASEQTDIRSAIHTLQNMSRQTARQFRVFLYVASLLLVALLVYVGLQLHGRSIALRRKVLFERTLAGISLSFVTAREQDFDDCLKNALAEMARCLGAERAYVVLRRNQSPRTYTWSSHPATFSSGWPDLAFTVMDRLGSTTNGTVNVPNVKRMPLGTNRNTLLAAGMQSWACITRHATGDLRILLGLDTITKASSILRGDELGSLQMALDVITHALSRQEAEQERARLDLRLQQARRLETVGTLASGIAHNFNNITGAILGYVEMANERVLTSDMVEGIRKAAERGRDLIDQILRFARPGGLTYGPVRVRALLADTLLLLQASWPSTVELRVSEIPAELVIWGADAPLQQVILNLCNNAAQAMDDVGHIELSVEAIQVATPLALSHGALIPGAYARISVSDSGRGMDGGTLKRIFEPFFTTRPTGNGLGLATALQIVREHGGAIDAWSTVGVGSRFEVWLPQTAANRSLPRDSAAPALPLGCGETVLILEDDAENLLKDEEMFAALGYEPVGSTDATDVYAMCREAPERFDVVIVGHLAAVTAALEVAAALHEIAPRVAILLASASADDLDANALVGSGISDVVHWPFITTEIAEALQACLRYGATCNLILAATENPPNLAADSQPADGYRTGLARYHATFDHPSERAVQDLGGDR